MSLRHKDPSRQGITAESVVFDDLADLLIEVRSLIPESIIPERNGVGFDTLVEAFVQMSASLSRFESTDESRHATEYTRFSDEAIGHLDLLRFRVGKHKENLSNRIISGERGDISKDINCMATMNLLKNTAGMMRSRVVRSRERANKEWIAANDSRRAAMLAVWQKKKEEKLLRRQENKERYALRHVKP